MTAFPTNSNGSSMISNEFSFGLPPLVPTRTRSTRSSSSSKWILKSSTCNGNFTSWSRVYENENTGVEAVAVEAVGISSNKPTTIVTANGQTAGKTAGQTTGQTSTTIPSASASAYSQPTGHHLLLPPLLTSVIAYSDDDYELFLKSKSLGRSIILSISIFPISMDRYPNLKHNYPIIFHTNSHTHLLEMKTGAKMKQTC